MKAINQRCSFINCYKLVGNNFTYVHCMWLCIVVAPALGGHFNSILGCTRISLVEIGSIWFEYPLLFSPVDYDLKAILRHGQEWWPWNLRALESNLKVVPCKLRLNFVRSWAFKCSLKTYLVTKLSIIKFYFITILFMWVLLRDKIQ